MNRLFRLFERNAPVAPNDLFVRIFTAIDATTGLPVCDRPSLRPTA